MARTTFFLFTPTFFILSFLGAVFAANDWSKPCLGGVCYYDLPSTNGKASSGSLKIWGSPDAISDITTAAGWEIIDCKKDTLAQDIRLVCTGTDVTCNHLYNSIGAEGKIVRLPENCGANAFARVSRAWVPEDQSVPPSIAKRLVRRAGPPPEVKALSLDTNFAAADAEKTGPINFALTGSNIPGAKDISPFPSSKTSPQPKTKRGFFSSIKKAAKKVANKVADVASSAVKAVKNTAKALVGTVDDAIDKIVDVVKDTADTAIDFVKDAVEAVKDLNEVSFDKEKTLPPLLVEKSATLVDETLSCPPIQGRLKIDVNAKANALATVGLAAEGTIIPPRVTDFAVTATLTGEIDGTLTMIAGIAGTLDSGNIKLVEVGIPGLDFPGLLTVGPTFRVDARANANLDLTANIDVGINYRAEKATFVFPPDSNKGKAQGGVFNPGNTPLKLTVAPSVKATGRVEAHLIPSLNLVISALGGIADARVFVNLDASAAMQLDFEGSGQSSVIVTPASQAQRLPAGQQPQRIQSAQPSQAAQANQQAQRVQGGQQVPPARGGQETQSAQAGQQTQVPQGGRQPQRAQGGQQAQPTQAGQQVQPAQGGQQAQPAQGGQRIQQQQARDLAIRGSGPMGGNYFAARQLNTEVSNSASFGGCFEISAGLDVNIGADAKFFGLFDTGTKANLFNADFELFKRCFGNRANAPRRRSIGRLAYIAARSPQRNQLERRILSCSASSSEQNLAQESVVDEVIPTSQLKFA